MEIFDGKCFIDSNSKYSKDLFELFNRGEIPSFRELFAHTEIARLSHEDKKGKDIIQFSFFVRGKKGRIMLLNRVDPGHVITKGKSILISWSPYLQLFSSGNDDEYREEDILNIYDRELFFPEVERPLLRYAGFARNVLPSGRVYYFHVFEAKYDSPEEVLESKIREVGEKQIFIKDKEAFLGFFSPEEILNQGNVTNRVDMNILKFIQNQSVCDLTQHEENDSCRFISWEGFFQGKRVPGFLFS